MSFKKLIRVFFFGKEVKEDEGYFRLRFWDKGNSLN